MEKMQKIYEEEYEKFEQTVRERVANESAKTDAQREAEKINARMETLGTELVQLHPEPTKNRAKIAEITAEMKQAETRLQELTPETKRSYSDFAVHV